MNKYIEVAYKLYTVEDGKKHLVEEVKEQDPFRFISGFGVALEPFEKVAEPLNNGETFTLQLNSQEAYGEYFEERVVELDKQMFFVEGEFDHQHVRIGSIIPLQNEDGNRFNGRVTAIGDDKVTVDLNHPLAGKEILFEGTVLLSREATNEEIQHLANLLSGEHCGCGGDGCCGHHHDHDDCHNHKHKGCGDGHGGCGHCH